MENITRSVSSLGRRIVRLKDRRSSCIVMKQAGHDVMYVALKH